MYELLAITVFTISLLLDIVLYRNLKIASKALSYTNVVAMSFAATLFLFSDITLFYALFALATFFRIINIGRSLERRMSEYELNKKVKRSILWLNTLSILLILLSLSSYEPTILQLLLASLLGASLLLLTTLISLNRWRSGKLQNMTDISLPTVTIGIPARNETQDLPECIESMLASDYPKLEIIVLDDCSHDKTPEIIKEYAHQGVRFIRGTEPDKDWLPKNQAMNKIFDESKGNILIFAGVDVRFSKQTVRQIVAMLQNGHDMISVLPKRSPKHELSVFIQPLRYWWELSVPRIFGSRPPVLSTCWAIKRESLVKLGEFDSYRKSVQPESHFSKRLKESYQFVISGNRLGIISVKPAREQYDTAIRTRYPQTKRRLESLFLLLTTELLLFFTPLYGLAYGIINNNSEVLLLSLISIGIFITINTVISSLTVTKTWFIGLFSLPFLLAEEWFILLRSMFAYEFGSVIWKERNICLPMYKVEKELPQL